MSLSRKRARCMSPTFSSCEEEAEETPAESRRSSFLADAAEAATSNAEFILGALQVAQAALQAAALGQAAKAEGAERVKVLEDARRVQLTAAMQLRAAADGSAGSEDPSFMFPSVVRMANRVLEDARQRRLPCFAAVSNEPHDVEVLDCQWQLLGEGGLPRLTSLLVQEVATGFRVALPVDGMLLPPLDRDTLWSSAAVPPLPPALRLRVVACPLPTPPEWHEPEGAGIMLLPFQGGGRWVHRMVRPGRLLVMDSRTSQTSVFPMPACADDWVDIDQQASLLYRVATQADGAAWLYEVDLLSSVVRKAALPPDLPHGRVAVLSPRLLLCWAVVNVDRPTVGHFVCRYTLRPVEPGGPTPATVVLTHRPGQTVYSVSVLPGPLRYAVLDTRGSMEVRDTAAPDWPVVTSAPRSESTLLGVLSIFPVAPTWCLLYNFLRSKLLLMDCAKAGAVVVLDTPDHVHGYRALTVLGVAADRKVAVSCLPRFRQGKFCVSVMLFAPLIMRASEFAPPADLCQ